MGTKTKAEAWSDCLEGGLPNLQLATGTAFRRTSGWGRLSNPEQIGGPGTCPWAMPSSRSLAVTVRVYSIARGWGGADPCCHPPTAPEPPGMVATKPTRPNKVANIGMSKWRRVPGQTSLPNTLHRGTQGTHRGQK